MKWYSITELSRETGIADSTIRRYTAKFKDFFMAKGGSRSKRYDETALKIIIRIKELYDAGCETEQIYESLLDSFPLIADAEKPPATTNPPALATADDIAEIKRLLQAQQELSNRLLDRLARQEESLRDAIDRRDRDLLRLIDSETKTDKTDNRTFWQRLFTR